MLYEVITRTMDSDAREGFISLFEEDAHMAAFAVMGGVFSEGIDLQGEKLIGAVIVGTGFPMISLKNNFIKEFHNTKDEEGLGYAYIYPGFNKVLQAAGRVRITSYNVCYTKLLRAPAWPVYPPPFTFTRTS